MLDQKLYTFMKLVECKSTVLCASQLYITQPAVSQHIKALETQYEISLFNREGRELVLTDEGKLFYQMIKRLINMENQIIEKIKEPSIKNIKFGVTLSINEGIIPHIFLQLIESFSDIQFHLIVHNTQTLLEYLESGIIDFALIEGNFNQNIYRHFPLMKEEFTGFCKKGGKYSEFTQLKECLSAPLLLREKGSGTRTIFENECNIQNIQIDNFKKVYEIGSITVIKNLLKADMGITFAYRCAVAEEIKNGEIQPLPLVDFDIIRTFYFVTLSDNLKSQANEKIYSKLKELIVKFGIESI